MFEMNEWIQFTKDNSHLSAADAMERFWYAAAQEINGMLSWPIKVDFLCYRTVIERFTC